MGGEEECFTPLCAALSRTSAKSAGSLQGRKAALEDAAAMAMRCAEFARRVLKTAGNSGLQVAARSQRRGMAKGIGNLPVKENSYVESWAKRREHVEDDFRWDGKTMAILAAFGVGVPVFFYRMIVHEYHAQDDAAGRPRRKLMGYD